MKTKQKIISSALLIACSSFSAQSHAVLADGSILNLDTFVLGGYYGNVVVSGSYFGMDNSSNNIIEKSERVGLTNNDGVIIGTTQSASGTHSGAPDGSETAGIDQAWGFFGNTGLHLTSSPTSVISASGNTATIDFSGWTVTWNSIASIPMSGGAWETGFTNGEAQLTCTDTVVDGVECGNGDTFVLDYSATVPFGDPSGFGNVQYHLHLEGSITVPNAPPVVSDFTTSMVANTTPSISLITNGSVSDPDGNLDTTSAVISNTIGSCGAVTNNGDGTVTLPACPGANSGYTFDYTFDDDLGDTSNTGTVTVNISANPAPSTIADSATTNSTTPVDIDVPANDSDNSALDLTSVTVDSAPSHGGTSVNATTGVVTYTANASFSGSDAFTYTIDDDTAQTSASTTVTVTVNAEDTPSSDGTFTAGTTDTTGDTTDGIVTAADIGVIDNGSSAEQGISQTCIGGCFDFTISGISVGSEATIVLPLNAALPTPSVGNSLIYRKLNAGGNWQNFDFSGNNAIHTAAGTVGASVVCPPASDTSYNSSPGLTVGHQCVRLTITDGGPNDSDGTADGTVTDPGGIAQSFFIDTRSWGTDGCSMSGISRNANNHADWWLLSAFIGLLGWFSLKRKQA